MTKITADPIVPYLNAVSALLDENALTVKMPNKEQIIPSEAQAKGIYCNIYWLPPNELTVALVIEAAKAIHAIIEPQ